MTAFSTGATPMCFKQPTAKCQFVFAQRLVSVRLSCVVYVRDGCHASWPSTGSLRFSGSRVD